MSHDFKESDWKLLRKLKPLALDRLCERILAELRYLASDSEQSNHERFLTVYKAIHDRNEELAAAFDDLKRSNGLIKLARMKSFGLVTDEELAQFSPETQDAVRFFVDQWQQK